MTTRWQGKVIWITGGGTGIGRALAHRFAALGGTVIVTGRREEPLAETVRTYVGNAGSIHYELGDVTDQASQDRCVANIVSTHKRIDVCIANAGFSVSGALASLQSVDLKRQFETNVYGAMHSFWAALPQLKKTQGRMVLVGSVMGIMNAPKNGVYASSKAALRSLSLTLSMELHGSGVSATLIEPGFVESEIGRVDNLGNHHQGRKDPRPASLMWTAVAAADVVERAIYRRKREYIFTWHGKIAAFFAQHMPGFMHLILRGR